MSIRFRFEAEKHRIKPEAAGKVDSALSKALKLPLRKPQSSLVDTDQTESEKLWQAAAQNNLRL